MKEAEFVRAKTEDMADCGVVILVLSLAIYKVHCLYIKLNCFKGVQLIGGGEVLSVLSALEVIPPAANNTHPRLKTRYSRGEEELVQMGLTRC